MAMLIVEGFQQTDEMGRSRHENQDMKDLVRIAPDIKSAWFESLGYSSLQHCQF